METEAAFATKFQMPYAIGMVNGTCTMQIALIAEGIGKGDEVHGTTLYPALTLALKRL